MKEKKKTTTTTKQQPLSVVYTSWALLDVLHHISKSLVCSLLRDSVLQQKAQRANNQPSDSKTEPRSSRKGCVPVHLFGKQTLVFPILMNRQILPSFESNFHSCNLARTCNVQITSTWRVIVPSFHLRFGVASYLIRLKAFVPVCILVLFVAHGETSLAMSSFGVFGSRLGARRCWNL